jgi:hypothetical protein
VSSTGYQVKLTGPGLSVDKELPEELAHRIAMLVLSGGKLETPDLKPKELVQKPNTSIHNQSIREYLQETKATKIPQQMTVIGNYLLETQSGKKSFTIADIEKGFGDAKESVPGNPHRDIGKAIKTGWIASRPDEKDSYYVTGTGLTAITNKFPKSKQKRRKKKPATKTK